MFCVQCGNQLNDVGSFCPLCGAKQKDGAIQTESPGKELSPELDNRPKIIGGILVFSGLVWILLAWTWIGLSSSTAVKPASYMAFDGIAWITIGGLFVFVGIISFFKSEFIFALTFASFLFGLVTVIFYCWPFGRIVQHGTFVVIPVLILIGLCLIFSFRYSRRRWALVREAIAPLFLLLFGWIAWCVFYYLPWFNYVETVNGARFKQTGTSTLQWNSGTLPDLGTPSVVYWCSFFGLLLVLTLLFGLLKNAALRGLGWIVLSIVVISQSAGGLLLLGPSAPPIPPGSWQWHYSPTYTVSATTWFWLALVLSVALFLISIAYTLFSISKK